jgi:hypothetical protein
MIDYLLNGLIDPTSSKNWTVDDDKNDDDKNDDDEGTEPPQNRVSWVQEGVAFNRLRGIVEGLGIVEKPIVFVPSVPSVPSVPHDAPVPHDGDTRDLIRESDPAVFYRKQRVGRMTSDEIRASLKKNMGNKKLWVACGRFMGLRFELSVDAVSEEAGRGEMHAMVKKQLEGEYDYGESFGELVKYNGGEQDLRVIVDSDDEDFTLMLHSVYELQYPIACSDIDVFIDNVYMLPDHMSGCPNQFTMWGPNDA